MYAEEYEQRGFPFRDFLLKLILIIIFVFLLIWLLPKFISPTVVNNSKNCPNNICDTSGLDALTSQIFADNLEKMKEAAISYYTDERLPKEVGESDKMTLSDMIGKHLIVALIDKNNKAVDVDASYVKITKLDEEYLLKVNIKDSEKEDYILVHLGCYTYCDSYLCEKQNTNVPIKGSKPTPEVPIKGDVNDKGEFEPEPSNSPKPTNSPECPECPECPTCPSESPEVPKPTDSPEEPEPSESPKPTDSPKPSEKPGYIYEYQKTTSNEFSKWTSWSNWSRTSCATQEINCNDNSPTCLKKLQIYKQKEHIGSYDKKYVKTRSVLKQTGSYNQKTCSKYNYVIINKTTYSTTTTTTYTDINTISGSTSSGGWRYNGRGSYKNPPRDTGTTHYKFVGADYSYCNDTCETLPNYYYDSYTYTGGLSSVSNTTSVPGDSSSSGGSSDDTSVSAKCGSYVTKNVPIYGSIDVSEIATRREPLYGTVCYQSIKTRKLLSTGQTYTKWSEYDDKSLLNNGWTYTGRKKRK